MVERNQNAIPRSPFEFDWTSVFPVYNDVRLVDFLDVTCGHGSTLVTLSTVFPRSLMLGIDTREEVLDSAEKRIENLRNRYAGQYTNIGVYKIDAKRHLQNFFFRRQFSKIFFHYAKPQDFSLREHKESVVNHDQVSEHAYLLAEQVTLTEIKLRKIRRNVLEYRLKPLKGKAYIVSDSRAVFRYVVSCYENHPSFLRVNEAEMAKDPVAKKLIAVEKKGCIRSNIRIAAFRKMPDEIDSEDAGANDDLDDLDDEIIEELMSEDAQKGDTDKN